MLNKRAVTYSGVKQSAFPDAAGSGNPLNDSGAVTLFQATTTPANTNAWAVLIGVATTSSTATAGSNTTIRKQQSNNLYYGDSGGPIWRPEATGLNWTASSARWLANYFALTPSVSYPGTTATSTYAYDANGNLTSLTVGATTTTYIYDYRNRLTESKVTGSASTTYAYGPAGNRISQITGSTTTIYPSKYYSLVTTSGATSTATSTEYIYSGSTLFATIDQYILNGTATGTAITRYNHTDHLGSTAVTSDQVGNLAQSFSYAPYGAVLGSTNTGTTTAARGYIGQFTDQSGLSYLNARYYASSQGQFTTQDPVFLGDPRAQNLANPQSLNSYSYAEGNPIVKEDPTGRTSALIPGQGFVYDYNGTNESVCCTFSSPNGLGNVNPAPPPGTANGYLPSPSNGFGNQWIPGYTSGTTIPSSYLTLHLPAPGDKAAQMKFIDSIGVGPAGGAKAIGGAGLIREAGEIIERNGLKFPIQYYNELRAGGFPAPALIANEIISAGTKAADTAATKATNFVVYEYAGWRVVIDPVTKFIQHLGR